MKIINKKVATVLVVILFIICFGIGFLSNKQENSNSTILGAKTDSYLVPVKNNEEIVEVKNEIPISISPAAFTLHIVSPIPTTQPTVSSILTSATIKVETNQITAIPTLTSIPTPTSIPTTTIFIPPTLTLVPTKTISIEQEKAPKIISISDSLGNTHEINCWWSDTHYECTPKEQKEPVVSIKITPQLTFTINAQDPNNRSLTYHYYYSEGCRGEGTNWITSNSCTFTIKTNELGLRTFIFYVKNDDNYGSVGLDANTALRYRITE